MQYPQYFTAEDIMEFEYEYNHYLDMLDPELAKIEQANVEAQLWAQEQAEQAVEDAYPSKETVDSWRWVTV